MCDIRLVSITFINSLFTREGSWTPLHVLEAVDGEARRKFPPRSSRISWATRRSTASSPARIARRSAEDVTRSPRLDSMPILVLTPCYLEADRRVDTPFRRIRCRKSRGRLHNDSRSRRCRRRRRKRNISRCQIPLSARTRPCWLNRAVRDHTATLSSGRRVDVVEDDAMIQNAP